MPYIHREKDASNGLRFEEGNPKQNEKQIIEKIAIDGAVTKVGCESKGANLFT